MPVQTAGGLVGGHVLSEGVLVHHQVDLSEKRVGIFEDPGRDPGFQEEESADVDPADLAVPAVPGGGQERERQQQEHSCEVQLGVSERI